MNKQEVDYIFQIFENNTTNSIFTEKYKEFLYDLNNLKIDIYSLVDEKEALEDIEWDLRDSIKDLELERDELKEKIDDLEDTIGGLVNQTEIE